MKIIVRLIVGDICFLVTFVDARSIHINSMTVSVVVWISPSIDNLSTPTSVICPS